MLTHIGVYLLNNPPSYLSMASYGEPYTRFSDTLYVTNLCAPV